jgi:hypothetical protein
MFRRSTLTMVGLLLLSGLDGAANEADSPWIRGIFTGKSPRVVSLAETDAWQRASELASMTPGAFVLIGGGESMRPLYEPGTILVLQPCSYERLACGETALYRSHSGRVVAHVLITKARDGWRVAGLNNRMHDMEPVVKKNLVGIVIAAFRPLGTGAAMQVAATGR